MNSVMNSIIFGFKEILSWRTMKYVTISGVIVSLIWLGIGMFIWDGLTSFSSRIIEMVPFSMIRSNGAWMLSTFLWFQLTLITFALIFAFFGNLILRKVSKEKYSTFSVLMLVGSALFWGVVWFFKGNYIYHQFLQLLTWLPFETVEKGIAFLIGFYIIYNAIVVSLVFLASIFSEPLIELIEIEHFSEDDVVRDNVFKTTGYTIRDSAIFIGISILAFPLLFVPVLNIFIQVMLWIWLVKDTMSYDAASLTHEKVDRSILKEHRATIWFVAFVTVLFNFIPVFNIFGPFFGLITMFHYFKTLEAR